MLLVERRCDEKTARGNVYRSRAKARRAARVMTARTRNYIVAFLCPHCLLFHIGKPS
jgi:hypothetical protein